VPDRASHRIRARPAEAREAQLLRIPLGSALLWIEYCSCTASGQVFEYGDTGYRADRYEIIGTMVQTPTGLRLQC